MGSTGQTVSTVMTEAVGIRCPIGDCRVLDAPFNLTSNIEIGHAYARSNMLVIALQDRPAASTEPAVACAYEIPKLAIGPAFPISCRVAAAWPAGMRVGFNDASQVVVPFGAGYNCIGYALEAKAANASNCLIHFKGDAAADIAISST